MALTKHPVSSSSVNLAGQKNIIEMKTIRQKFQHKVDLILDGGSLKSTKGSSVIDISSSPPSLLREGEISKEVLEKMIGTKIKSDISRKFVITFVCSGNICRSPVAEGILKKKLDIDMLKGKVEVNSAGTLKLPTSVASINAVDIAAEHKVDIENHLSRPVSKTIVDRANLILCMAENHYDYFIKHYPADKDKIHLLKGYYNSGNFTGLSIDDPIGKSEEFYRRIYHEIEQEIDRILPGMLKEIVKYVYPF
jgi:protein-tyrosine-phosphatase